MGEAKRRTLAREKLNEAMKQVDLPRLAAAMRKLATAASGQIGGDCYIHAGIAQAILRCLGVEAKVIVGFSAWRVGDAGGDVLTHCPIEGMPVQLGVAYHVWLEIGSYILDLTLYQLKLKCKSLDDLDGGHTNVDWHPEYLYVPKTSVSSLQDVTQLGAGLYYYQHDPEVEARVIAAASKIDGGDVETAWTLYQNPDIAVFGPNDVHQK